MKFVKEKEEKKRRDSHEQKKTHQTRYKTFHPHTQSPMSIEDK